MFDTNLIIERVHVEDSDFDDILKTNEKKNHFVNFVIDPK